jgi:hypothetical protein
MPAICCNAGIVATELGNGIGKLNHELKSPDFAGLRPANLAASTDARCSTCTAAVTHSM